MVFVPVYWAWVGTTIHANTHDVDNPRDRVGIFALGLCGLVMALAIPGAYGGRGPLFGIAYLAVRGLLLLLVRHAHGMVARPFRVAAFFTGPLLIVGGFLDGPARPAVWAIAAVADLSTPVLTRRHLAGVRFNAEHLPERFGLFLIIALGESITAIGTPAAQASHLDAGVLGAVAVAFALACGLWWLYFAFAAEAMRRSLATAPVQTDVIRQVLAYGHLAFLAAIIAVSVGIDGVVEHPGAPLERGSAGLLFGGAALYLATFGYTRWQILRTWATTSVWAAAVVLVLLPVGLLIPGIAALALLAAVVLPLNVVEHLAARRTPAPDL